MLCQEHDDTQARGTAQQSLTRGECGGCLSCLGNARRAFVEITVESGNALEGSTSGREVSFNGLGNVGS